MPINPDAVGAELASSERSWTSTDCILYALGVGAGVDDLPFTTENTAGVTQLCLPTMAVVLGAGGRDLAQKIGSFDWAGLVHAEQAFSVHRPLPVEGRVHTTAKVAQIFDKGKGALVVIECHSTDPATGASLFSTRSSLYLRGEGGWGGDRGPGSAGVGHPDRSPDHSVSYPTSRDQALLYRLSGDRNPLHSDPSFAAKAGFDRPILHGLCTFGFAGRALLRTVCDGDPDRFLGMEGRFSSIVLPGDELTTSVWVTESGLAVFETVRTDGTPVLSAGRCRFTV